MGKHTIPKAYRQPLDTNSHKVKALYILANEIAYFTEVYKRIKLAELHMQLERQPDEKVDPRNDIIDMLKQDLQDMERVEHEDLLCDTRI